MISSPYVITAAAPVKKGVLRLRPGRRDYARFVQTELDYQDTGMRKDEAGYN